MCQTVLLLWVPIAKSDQKVLIPSGHMEYMKMTHTLPQTQKPDWIVVLEWMPVSPNAHQHLRFLAEGDTPSLRYCLYHATLPPQNQSY